MQLTEHFHLAEFTVSETAARQGISNEPPPSVIDNLHRLALTLEQVRALLGTPLTITSGYRSRVLNTMIDGSNTSAHCHGLAADFIAPPLAVLEVSRRIEASEITFDQLIFEHTWIHLAIADHPRRMVLTLRADGGYDAGTTATT